MALLHSAKQEIQRNTFAGPEISLVETSGSSGERSMISTSFSHSPLRMKRNEPFQDSTSGKKIKLELLDGGYNVHKSIHGLPQTVTVNYPASISMSPEQSPQEADLPSDFLEPLSPETDLDNIISYSSRPTSLERSPVSENNVCHRPAAQASRQFWKAGDYEGESAERRPLSGGMDHVRVHPKFLHSNATSHKWALGALAELLDNALDEAVRGATFVKVDVRRRQGEESPLLLIEDDGGGMDPECLRHCMSLGYSVKSKMANTIGQYGNGFKTSTMRLGADVIVFSCSLGRDGSRPTRSVGLLSYTFLRETGQQDIIVPMVDFEVQASGLQKLMRSSVDDWHRNMETLKRWSPFSTESELMSQFDGMKQQGTKIFVYNLWENDEGQLELDFDSNPHDIQVRGVNRDKKWIAMAERLPNSRHFLTYRHSLRRYASILYLRLPKNFKMILRGLEIKHHCLVHDLMITQKLTYRPQGGGQHEDEQEPVHQHDASQMKAVVTIGFVKDAKEHVDVQGFNVYHKNRLIKPFWRLWNSAGSHGRGIIGVLEANFVEPAHDKQGFERTSVLARLEARLLKMQKTYWFTHCHKVGYYNHHLKKKPNKVPTSDENSASLEKLKSGKTFPQTERQKVLNRPLGQSQRLFSQAFPRSSRSQTRRIPARRFHNGRGSTTHTQLALVSGEGYSTQSKEPDSCQADYRIETSDSDPLRVLNDEKDDPESKALGQGPIPNNRVAVTTPLEEQVRQLELQLVVMTEQVQVMQKKMEDAIKERDSLREELEEERKQGELNDAELRKKLRDTLLRVRELESANNRLQSAERL